MTEKKMIVFAPHPDDETLACGGTIVRKIREGYDVYVVVMTDGCHSHDIALGLKEPSPRTIAKIRMREFRKASRILGVPSHNLVFLGFEDSKLSQHVAKAVERTSRILKEILPTEIYVTYRRDNSEDHRAAYKIVKGSVIEANLVTGIYEYPVWNRRIPSTKLKVVAMDIHSELKTKIRALSVYKSQTSICFPRQEKAVLSEDFVKKAGSNSETFYVGK